MCQAVAAEVGAIITTIIFSAAVGIFITAPKVMAETEATAATLLLPLRRRSQLVDRFWLLVEAEVQEVAVAVAVASVVGEAANQMFSHILLIILRKVMLPARVVALDSLAETAVEVPAAQAVEFLVVVSLA